MKTGIRFLFISGGLSLLCACATPSRQALQPDPFRDGRRAYRLRNGAVELRVVPEIGRMMFFGPRNGENLLADHVEVSGDWLNYGGDWLWPVHQDRWAEMGGASWPPPAVLDGSWTAEAWAEADGTGVIVLRREIGEPLFVRMERRFRLAPGEEPVLRVEQSMVRFGASSVPVTLWQISQVANPDTVVMGRKADSRFPEGYRHISFNRLRTETMPMTADALIFRVREDLVHGNELQHVKFGSDATWLAARRGPWMLRLRADGGDQGGEYPDGGCAVTAYASLTLGYTEIETQSVEMNLAPGERLENVVEYRLIAVPEGTEEKGLVPLALDLRPHAHPAQRD